MTWVLKNIETPSWCRVSLREVDSEWFENHFFSRDLFIEEEAYLFLFSDEASKQLKENILSMVQKIERKCVLFIFRKDDILFKGLCGHSSVQGWQIKAPTPWNRDKFLDFLCTGMKLRLSRPVKEYLLDCVGEAHEMIHALKVVKGHVPQGTAATLETVRELVKPARVDLFKLGRLYGERKFILFYRELLQHDFPYDEYRNLFCFLQAHLMKIYDPSHGENKGYQSRYDRSVKEQRSKWAGQKGDCYLNRETGRDGNHGQEKRTPT